MLDDDDRPAEDQVKDDFEQMKEEVKGFSADDFKSGKWFAAFLRYILDNYAKKVNADYFKKKYPHLPAEYPPTNRGAPPSASPANPCRCNQPHPPALRSWASL